MGSFQMSANCFSYRACAPGPQWGTSVPQALWAVAPNENSERGYLAGQRDRQRVYSILNV